METALDVRLVAPDLTLRGEGGQPVTLSEHRGWKNAVEPMAAALASLP